MLQILKVGFCAMGLLWLSSTADAGKNDFLNSVRLYSWSYPTDVTTEEAKAMAKQYRESGINFLLTNGHRYILPIPDDPAAYNDPFHFELAPTEKNNKATSTVVQAMREQGLKVGHHVTAAYCPKLEMEKHPDWCQKSIFEPEKPLFFEEYGGVYLYCLNNPDFRKEYYKRVYDLQKEMGFDAWMIDEVEWLPDWYVCGCRHCREKFKKETGYDLPTDKNSEIWGDFTNPIWRAWIAARMRWCGDFFRDLRSYLEDNGIHDLPLTACHAGITSIWSSQYWGIDVVELTRGIDWVFYEAFVGNGAPFYSWRRYIAEIQVYSALARAKTDHNSFVLFYPMGAKEEFDWCWSAAYTLGQRSWYRSPYIDGIKWEQRHEYLSYPKGKEIVDVGLVFSHPTRDFYSDKSKMYLYASDLFVDRGYVNEWSAWAEAIVESNTPHEVLMDDMITSSAIDKYKALLLPSTECLSDAQVKALLDYAAKGGKLVVSGTPAKCDETGKKRESDELTKKLLDAAYLKIDAVDAEKALIGFIRFGKPIPARDDKAHELLTKELAKVLSPDELSFSVESATGVVVKGWENETGRRMKLNILNCVGTDLKTSTVLNKGYDVTFAKAPVKVRVKKIVAGNPRYAVLYEPANNDSQILVPEEKDGFIEFSFDIEDALCVLEWEKYPLSQDINWTKKQNANWFVLGEKLSSAEADAAAQDMLDKGINALLTDKHRYILYDCDDYDQDTSAPFDNIWQGRPLRQSVELTRNVVDACHKRDMRVIWHTTYCMVSRDLKERHPDWSQEDLRNQGIPVFFKMYGGNWNICINNKDAREAYFKRVAELTKETGVDGWMIDEVEWLPEWYECGCKTCMEKFTRETGFVMPTETSSPVHGNYNDPIWRAWTTWRMKCCGEFFKDLREYMDGQGLHDLSYTCCHAGAADTWSGQVWGIDEFELSKGMNLCFYEAYIGNGAPYFGWKRHLVELDLYGAIARNRTPSIPVLSLFYPRVAEESFFTNALTYFAGHRPWVVYSYSAGDFALTLWERQHQKLFASGEQKTLANVGLYFSKPTRDLLGKDEKQENNGSYINHYANWNINLIENNVPYQTIITDDIEGDKLQQYKVIIAPAAKLVSDKEIASLTKWAKDDGGKLIINDDFAICDETGLTRKAMTEVNSLKKLAYKILPETKGNSPHQVNYAIVDKVWKDGRTDKDKKEMTAILSALQNEYTWQTDTTTKDAVIRLWTLPDGRIVAHLINTLGTNIPNDTKIEKTVDGGITWKTIEKPIHIVISADALESADSYKAKIYGTTDDKETVSCETLPNGALSLTINGLKDYAVVELTK